MLRVTAVFGFTMVLSGCASTAGTFFNRPVVEDQVGEVMHTVSLSADRRTVIVVRPGVGVPKFCAEPPPDTATALKTDLDAMVKAKGNELGIKDKFDTSVTVLSSRNAPLDAFRTGMFSLCQFYLNGAIKDSEVSGLFRELLATFKETQNLVYEVPKKTSTIDMANAGGTGPADKPKPEASGAAPATTLETKKASK